MMSTMKTILNMLKIVMKRDGWNNKTRNAEQNMTRMKEREFSSLLTWHMRMTQELRHSVLLKRPNVPVVKRYAQQRPDNKLMTPTLASGSKLQPKPRGFVRTS